MARIRISLSLYISIYFLQAKLQVLNIPSIYYYNNKPRKLLIDKPFVNKSNTSWIGREWKFHQQQQSRKKQM